MAAGFPITQKTNTEPKNASLHLHNCIWKANQEPQEMVFCTWTCSCGV